MTGRVNPYAGFADDAVAVASLPEAPERVLASARAIYTLFAGYCQPEPAAESAVWPRGDWPVGSWPAGSCGDLSGLAADLYTGGGS